MRRGRAIYPPLLSPCPPVSVSFSPVVAACPVSPIPLSMSLSFFCPHPRVRVGPLAGAPSPSNTLCNARPFLSKSARFKALYDAGPVLKKSPRSNKLVNSVLDILGTTGQQRRRTTVALLALPPCLPVPPCPRFLVPFPLACPGWLPPSVPPSLFCPCTQIFQKPFMKQYTRGAWGSGRPQGRLQELLAVGVHLPPQQQPPAPCRPLPREPNMV